MAGALLLWTAVQVDQAGWVALAALAGPAPSQQGEAGPALPAGHATDVEIAQLVSS